MADAKFEGTTVFAGKKNHKLLGLVHLLGYQNTPTNLSSGPNAMLLHIPSAQPMTERNNIDVSQSPKILADMVTAVKPVSRGLSFGLSKNMGADSVAIFDSGIYTVVLSAKPSLIPAALKKVPANKRPKLNSKLFKWYEKNLPGYSVAVCCFDSKDANEADPILFWYYPQDPNQLVAPGLDAHDGSPPVIGSQVECDHWVIYGSDAMQSGSPVRYTDKLDPTLADFLPTKVVGQQFQGDYQNGDFVASLADVEQGRIYGKVERKVL
jgi:hypothetical protein